MLEPLNGPKDWNEYPTSEQEPYRLSNGMPVSAGTYWGSMIFALLVGAAMIAGFIWLIVKL